MRSMYWLIIAVISIIAVILLSVYLIPYLNIDFLSMITGTSDLGLFEESDYTQLDDYTGYELSYEGMILEKDSGVDDVNSALQDYSKAWDCSDCSSCSQIAGLDTECSSCNACGDEVEANRFKNCLVCDIDERTCTMCYDTDEYELCNEIKSCILEYYGNPYYGRTTGCFLREIPHNDGTSFDMNTLKNILSTCKDESIIVNMGGDFDKELCYFNASSISYYDVERPHDFYMGVEATGRFGLPTDPGVIRYTNKILSAFEIVNGEIVSRYRISVGIQGTGDTNYQVMIGKNGGHQYPLGIVHTNEEGFGSAIFEDLPEQWKADVKNQDNTINEDKNELDAVMVMSHVTLTATFYIKNPVSSDAWSFGLRYPHCNFDTDPEPFLEGSPWWTDRVDDISSPLYTYDDPNSSVKVFYDSSMPGGGSSSNRGNIELQLGRLDVDFQRNCMFDVYVCSQDAAAEYEDEGILDLNDFLTNFDLSYAHKTISVSNDEIILYNTFVMDLDKAYTPEEVKAAIETGFRTWEQTMFIYTTLSSNIGWFSNANNEGIYEGQWNEMTGIANYDEDCWNNDVNNMMSSDRRFLIGNCQNNICSGRLKVTVAFKYKPPSSYAASRYPLYPTISFCSQGSGSSATETPYTGLLGGCEEYSNYGESNYNSFSSNHCGYAWGAGQCNGNTCTCPSGTTKQTISDYDAWNGGKNYGRVYGCKGNVDTGRERIVGFCMQSNSSNSQTTYGCSRPEPWGNAYCEESGGNSYCYSDFGPADLSLKYMSSNYMINRYTSNEGYGYTQIATTKSPSFFKLLGTCQEVTKLSGYPVPRPVQFYCQYDWGDASCSGMSCTCPAGTTRIEINYGNLDIFSAPYTTATASLYGCVA